MTNVVNLSCMCFTSSKTLIPLEQINCWVKNLVTDGSVVEIYSSMFNACVDSLVGVAGGT